MDRQRPRLRNGVDLQLQSAFQDGNWAVAMRLAEQRSRTFKDQYFEIVKICAESQLDDPNAKFAAVAAIDKFVKDGTVVKDVDAIDLLEWSAVELLPENSFAETIGPLRVRAVKAAPKDTNAATRCLQSCLLHWDLVSAQQIAAIVDRSHPQERDFMFWNIVITHMLAMSSQSLPEKRKLYGTLAQKQIERAAQVTEQAHKAQTDSTAAPVRRIVTEEEILLLHDIVEAHGTADDMKKLIESPLFSPVAQFRLGRKELFQRTIAIYREKQQWQALYKLCEECLSHTDENDELTLLACDWSVWKQFLEAASHLRGTNTEIPTKVQDLLLKLARSAQLRPIYKRNVLLARVSAAFRLKSSDDNDMKDGKPSSLRLRELMNYIDYQKLNAACFDDIKEFLELLNAPALKFVAYEYTAQLAQTAQEPLQSARINLLSLKARYFSSTCTHTRTQIAGKRPCSKCSICNTEFSSESCNACLSNISEVALAAYRSARKDFDQESAGQTELLPGFAMVVAFCNIKLAFRTSNGYIPPSPPLSRYLLRALFILEHQEFLTPKHSQISLLLVQLHLLLGSAHRSREVWHGLSVKRTIVDSLSPVFYDRLSTVAPIILDSSDNWGWELVENLRSHYAVSLKLRMPRRLIDAFESSNYGSILDMPKYIENLRAGSTRALSLVEEVRADRLLGEPCGEFLNDPRWCDVSDDLVLKTVVDYGSFPSWDAMASAPLHERLQLGPAPSNTRSHLALLAEAFQDTLSYKPPTVYKATAAVVDIECTFVIETMSQLGNSMSKFLSTASRYCTSSEMLYYEAVYLLATLLPLSVGIDKTASLPIVLSQITKAVEASMATQLNALPSPDDTVEGTVSTLRSFHSITMLRDTAMAAKLTSQWILGFNEREKERDRSGNSNIPKDVITQIKRLQSSAEASLKGGKEILVTLKNQFGNGVEFGRRVREWAFEEEGKDLGQLVEDGTLKEMVESWRQNIAGWGQVKWE